MVVSITPGFFPANRGDWPNSDCRADKRLSDSKMQQNNNPRIRVLRLGLRGWAAIGVGLAVLIALATLAIGLMVVLLPLALLASVFYYFLPRPKISLAGYEPPTDPEIIDGEFHVVDAKPLADATKDTRPL
jgi:hypothetical protein